MGIKRGEEAGLDVFEDQSLQALGDGECECDRAVVIEVGDGRFLGNGDDGGSLQACWNVL